MLVRSRIDAALKTAFVSVSGAARTEMGRATAAENARAFLTRTGWWPDSVELVAGGEPYTKYGFFTRLFMVRHSKKLGRVVDSKRDYDFTDWDAVDRFARTLAGVPLPEAKLALV